MVQRVAGSTAARGHEPARIVPVGRIWQCISSPFLGTTVAEAVKVQSAPSTNIVAVPDGSLLITLSISAPQGMFTDREAPQASLVLASASEAMPASKTMSTAKILFKMPPC